jgi:hypothetical protein
MPRSNWRERFTPKLIAGIAVWTLIALIGVGAIARGVLEQVEYEGRSYERSAKYTADTYSPAYDSCFRLPVDSQANCVAEANNEYRENERKEQDLIAQQTTAVWTFLMGCAAIIGMSLSALGVYLVWTTFRETRKANEKAAEANSIAQNASKVGRAWMVPLGVDTNTIENSWLDGCFVADTLGFAVKWLNSGASPAIRATVYRHFDVFDVSIPKDQPVIDMGDIPFTEMTSIIGSGQTVNGPMAILSDNQIRRFRSREVYIILATKAFYFDVFSNPDDVDHLRITETRYVLEHGGGTVINSSGREIEAITVTMIGSGKIT